MLKNRYWGWGGGAEGEIYSEPCHSSHRDLKKEKQAIGEETTGRLFGRIPGNELNRRQTQTDRQRRGDGRARLRCCVVLANGAGEHPNVSCALGWFLCREWSSEEKRIETTSLLLQVRSVQNRGKTFRGGGVRRTEMMKVLQKKTHRKDMVKDVVRWGLDRFSHFS